MRRTSQTRARRALLRRPIPKPLPSGKGLSRRKRLRNPAIAAGPFRARGGTLLLAQVLSGRRRSQLSDGTGPRACTPTCEYGRFCLHGSTQIAGYRHYIYAVSKRLAASAYEMPHTRADWWTPALKRKRICRRASAFSEVESSQNFCF